MTVYGWGSKYTDTYRGPKHTDTYAGAQNVCNTNSSRVPKTPNNTGSDGSTKFLIKKLDKAPWA